MRWASGWRLILKKRSSTGLGTWECDRLSAALVAAELDALVVSDLVNVRYLSGFTGSNAALVVFAGDTPAVLATDSRYRTQAARQAPDLEAVSACLDTPDPVAVR